MLSRITDLLKEMETANKKETRLVEWQTVLPFIVIGKDGAPFIQLVFLKAVFLDPPFLQLYR